jgi:hypothetical protein
MIMDEPTCAIAASSRAPGETLARLVERTRECYLPSPVSARLDLVPAEAPGQGCRLHFGATLECTGLAPSAGQASVAATLELPARAFDWLLDNPDRVRPDHYEFLAVCGEHRLPDGQHGLGLVETWLQLLKRPSSGQRAQLEAAYGHSPLQACESDFELDASDFDRAVLRAIARRSPCRIRGAAVFDGDCRRLRAGLPADTYTRGAFATPETVRAIRWPTLPEYAFSGAQVWAGQRDEGLLTRLHCDTKTLAARAPGRPQARAAVFAAHARHALSGRLLQQLPARPRRSAPPRLQALPAPGAGAGDVRRAGAGRHARHPDRLLPLRLGRRGRRVREPFRARSARAGAPAGAGRGAAGMMAVRPAPLRRRDAAFAPARRTARGPGHSAGMTATREAG